MNPFLHLHADLTEVWIMGWSVDVLKHVGVTYDQLRDKGMNVDVMKHFGFTLSQWLNLGMRDRHVESLSEVECQHVLVLPRTEVLGILASYQF